MTGIKRRSFLAAGGAAAACAALPFSARATQPYPTLYDVPLVGGTRLKYSEVPLYVVVDEGRLDPSRLLLRPGEGETPKDRLRSAHRAHYKGHSGIQYKLIGDWNPNEGRVVENFIAPTDFTAKDGSFVKEGSWVMGVRYDEVRPEAFIVTPKEYADYAEYIAGRSTLTGDYAGGSSSGIAVGLQWDPPIITPFNLLPGTFALDGHVVVKMHGFYACTAETTCYHCDQGHEALHTLNALVQGGLLRGWWMRWPPRPGVAP